MDGHSGLVKSSQGTIVQVVRQGGYGNMSQPISYSSVDSGGVTSQNQRYVTTTSGSAAMRRLASQPSQPSMIARSGLTTVTPVQPRFMASSRLGTPQSVPAVAYGIKRPFTRDYAYEFSTVRKFLRGADKSKGLRHFSTKVCEKVKEKGHTNYNEVADELVTEYFDSLSQPPGDSEKQQYDVKNIRRRVYDALNVLMAMNIIEKEKKEIRWVGLPTSSFQECRRLEEEKEKRHERIRQKAEQLQELIIQLVAHKSLVERNRERERTEGRPAENTVLYLPYIVVNTEKKTMIDCAISHDKSEYLFNFDQPFEIHDDIEVLKRLGLAHGLERAEVPVDQRAKVKSYLPPALRDYVDQILEGTLCGGMVGPSVRVQQPVQIDRKPVMPSYSVSAPLMRNSGTAGMTQPQTAYMQQGTRSSYGHTNVISGAGASQQGGVYANQGGSVGGGMRATQARYAVVPRGVNGGANNSRYTTSTSAASMPSGAYRNVSSAAGTTAVSSGGRQYILQQGSGGVVQRNYATSMGGGASSSGGMQGITVSGGSGAVPTRQHSVAYTIQAPVQGQVIAGQRYEEVYEDEDENVHYE
ncbi:unnamed protein product [Anisakis simplex]|uniref:Transcription factor dpl-1 (inferred by orthology to a C. elegans protein) n=1 Tax=Anisakis simplex TaxID=6269 RepID=A0A0M3K423_ANISI|nr:unnamed protein product [Anisakis simplex]